jgi:hypothetical protein
VTLVDLGYKLKKPKLRRKPERPRVSRIKASDELVNKKKRQCNLGGQECQGLKHLMSLSTRKKDNAVSVMS